MKELKPKYCYLIIAVISFLVFLNTLGNDFVFDDESVVQNYAAIRDFSSIPKYFTAEEGFHKVIGNYYRPVVYATYTLDYFFWTMNPTGYHLTNSLINIIASMFLFAILARLFSKNKYGLFAALVSALIFAVHPVHTEAVSWISGRTDSLVTLFFFAAFYFYVVFSQEGKNKNLYLSLVFYLLGLLSKEMIVTFPVIIILFDFTWNKKSLKEIFADWKKYSYFIGLTVFYLIIRYALLHTTVQREKYNYFYGKDFITVLATMLKTIPVYLKLLFVPYPLLYHYNGVMQDSNSLTDMSVVLSILLLVALILTAFLLYKKESKISFVILFVLVTLLPVMNIIPTMNYMAERFLYVTSFSVALLIAYVITKFISEKNKNILIVLSLIVLVVFTVLTVKRNAEWKNNNTLYATGEGIDGSVLLVNCGNMYANNKQYDEAEKRYKRAIEIRYNNVLAHHNLGLIYLIKEKLDSAEINIKNGIGVDSLAPDGHFQLANIYQQEGRIPEAIEQLEKLQTIIPDYRGSKDILAMLKSKGDIQKTDNLENTGTPKNIDIKKVKLLEGESFKNYQEGKYGEAIKNLEELLKLNHYGRMGYYNNLAMCYDAIGNFEKAKENFIESIKCDAKNIGAMSGLASVQLKTGDTKSAIENYKKILSINPSDETAKKKLDSLKVK